MEQLNGTQRSGRLVVAAIYDSKVGCYFQPFFARSRAEAARSFGDAVNDPNHIFGKHAADFTLFVVAEWSEDTGKFESLDAPDNLGSGHEHQIAGPVDGQQTLV